MGTPGGKLLTGGRGKSNFFPTKQLTMQQYPEPLKTACNYGNAHKIAQISFIIYYTKITTFPTLGNFFHFSLEVWERRSHAFRRYGYSVPTRSLRKWPRPFCIMHIDMIDYAGAPESDQNYCNTNDIKFIGPLCLKSLKRSHIVLAHTLITKSLSTLIGHFSAYIPIKVF